MDSISSLILKETRFRLLEESIPRLKKCLLKMTVQDIWHRPNRETVSAGNLVLHLCGNVKQWLISGLGGRPDHRQREREFQERGPVETARLIQMLDDLSLEVQQVLDELQDADLRQIKTIQGYQVSGVAILIHVVEHFSYHVGQVTYIVKSKLAVDMGYYQGRDLNRLNES